MSTGVVVERFFGFIEIAHHDGNYLFTTTENMLSSDGIDIRNCRSQSYDNASNMSGVYSGVQAHMRKVNDLAVWVPCAAHSLNLVGASAAECCNHAVNFFGILQSLYCFFSASPQRWSVLTEHLPSNINVLKSLSETRWSARADASKALMLNYDNVRLSLKQLAASDRQPPAAVHDAKSLLNKLDKLETAIMCVVWNDILQHTDRVNKSLQEAGIELCTVVQLYDSLISHFRHMRNQFDEFESTAKRYVADDCDYVEAAARIRARKRMANDGPSTEVSLAPRENFIVSTFYVIVDQLLAEMVRRRAAYADLNDKFGFLTDKQLPVAQIKNRAAALVQSYATDLESDFVDEFMMFRDMCGTSDQTHCDSVADMLQMLISKKLVNTFPNVHIALRIYLSILGTSCAGERTFSVLKRVKNYQRSSLGECKLSALSLLAIEFDLVRNLNVHEVIEQFAKAKCRKASF